MDGAPLLIRHVVACEEGSAANTFTILGVGLPPALNETATKSATPLGKVPHPKSCTNAPRNTSAPHCLEYHMPRSPCRLLQSEFKLSPLFDDYLSTETNLIMPENWEFHKHVIEELYLTRGCTLEEVRKIMRAKHGFMAASDQSCAIDFFAD
jgi:hypothetical protein